MGSGEKGDLVGGEQDEQGPDGVGGSPELLRHESAVDGDQQNDGQERAQGEIAAELEEIEKRQRGGEDQQHGPEGEQRVSALVGVVVDEQRAERVDEGRGQQGDGG